MCGNCSCSYINHSIPSSNRLPPSHLAELEDAISRLTIALTSCGIKLLNLSDMTRERGAGIVCVAEPIERVPYGEKGSRSRSAQSIWGAEPGRPAMG